MYTFVVLLHVLVCLAVVLVVLLQQGKGADIGATFGGGGSQTVFGSRGAGNFLTKLTAVAGALFMLTSLGLAMMSSHGLRSSVVEGTPMKKEMPAMPTAPAQGQPGAPGQSAPPAMPAFPAPQGGK